MKAVFFCLLLASSARAADLPRFWTVHVDRPSDRAAFERIDAEDAAARRAFHAAHELPVPDVWRFATREGEYFAVRPRGDSWSDLDKPSMPPEQAKELAAVTAPMSARIHPTLRAHHNEIWRLEPDLTTVSAIPARRYAVLRIDSVVPKEVEAYGASMESIVKKLRAEGVDVIAFNSAYGDGTWRYVFLSDRPISAPRSGKARTRDETLQQFQTPGR